MRSHAWDAVRRQRQWKRHKGSVRRDAESEKVCCAWSGRSVDRKGRGSDRDRRWEEAEAERSRKRKREKLRERS